MFRLGFADGSVSLGARRILKPGRWRWLRALLWMVALFIACIVFFGSAMDALQQAIPKTEIALRFVGQIVLLALTLGVYATLVRLGELRWPSELALKPAIVETGLGLAIGAILFASVMTVLAGFGIYEITFTGPVAAWNAAAKALEAGIVEELAVRAIMLRLLWRAFGPAAAFALSALAFGGGHLFNSSSSAFAAICIMLEAGIMLGAFYALTGRLWMSIGVHAAWNFTQGYVFGAAVSGTSLGPALARSVAHPDTPFWLSGGEFGPEASLPALLICTAVGLAVLHRAWIAGKIARDPGESEADSL